MIRHKAVPIVMQYHNLSVELKRISGAWKKIAAGALYIIKSFPFLYSSNLIVKSGTTPNPAFASSEKLAIVWDTSYSESELFSVYNPQVISLMIFILSSPRPRLSFPLPILLCDADFQEQSCYFNYSFSAICGWSYFLIVPYRSRWDKNSKGGFWCYRLLVPDTLEILKCKPTWENWICRTSTDALTTQNTFFHMLILPYHLH